MDGTRLQRLIYAGYARAASHIGTPHAWYRGYGAIPSMLPQDQIGTLPASFSVDGQFQTPPNYATVLWRAFVDTTQAQVGDVLVGAYTWVLVRAAGIVPPLAIQCTDQITIQRKAAASQVGAQGYGGQPTITTIASGVPANINLKKEVGTPPAKLPGDTSRGTYWNVSFYAPDGAVRDRDIVIDSQGNRYQVTAANWQAIGYQCLCEVLED